MALDGIQCTLATYLRWFTSSLESSVFRHWTTLIPVVLVQSMPCCAVFLISLYMCIPYIPPLRIASDVFPQLGAGP
jgi:hypothetical protein